MLPRSILIDSVPPAMMQSAMPAMIRSAAIAMVCEPDEQKRLTVTAGTSCGRPARSAAIRATFEPDSASGVAQPMMTSSIDSGGSGGNRFNKSAITAAARSSGRVVRSVPRGALPTAVRTPATITASFISLAPQFRFTLEIQEVLFINPLSRGDITTTDQKSYLVERMQIGFCYEVSLTHDVQSGTQGSEGVAPCRIAGLAAGGC